VSTAQLTRSIVERRYLTIGYLATLLGRSALRHVDQQQLPPTYIGLDRPEGLPDNTEVYTLDRLHELIPQ
jgi:hypothetical protein